MKAPPLLAALLARPPRRLSDLEAMVGPVFMNIDKFEGSGFFMRPFDETPFFCLEVLTGPDAGRKLRLCAREATRLGHGHVRVALAGAGIHDSVAEITVTDGGVQIEDLGAPNGIRVGGEQVHRSRRLSGGDSFEIGSGNWFRLTEVHPRMDRFSDEVAYLSVTFDHDMYHQDPYRYRDPELTEYTLHLAGDQAAAEALLAASFGPPRRVTQPHPPPPPGRETRYLAFEPFYLVETFRPGEMCLCWYERRPEFAQDRPDEEQRGRFFGSLATFLAGCQSHETLVAFARSLPPTTGIQMRDPTGAHEVSFTLSPPMEALALARAIGIQAPSGTSTDVHRSHWSLREGAHGDEHASWNLPRIGRWEVEASLETIPLPLVKEGYPRVYDLTRCHPNRVYHVALSLPRR